MKRILPTLAVTGALFAAASPAASAAKAERYSGTTEAGYPISFVVKGNKLSKLKTTVPTTCIPSKGVPRAGGETFEPPGSFRFGREGKVTATQTPAMHYADVTKNYRVTLSRFRRNRFTARLHVNFSFLTVDFSGSSPALNPWVCQGDDKIKARRY
jgi:hypothetical protein